MAKKKKIEEDKDLFDDDCPVCRAMKFAQENGRIPTPLELIEAFKKVPKF